MKSTKDAHFVADGQERIQADEQYRLREHAIRVAVASKYRVELANAGLFRRMAVRLKMRREVRQELQKLAPDQGLYFKV